MSTPESLSTKPEIAMATLDDASDRLPSRGLLSFYDSLRGRISAGRMGRRSLGLLMVVPDAFMLVARLAIDRRVPRETRALFAGTMAYFLLPTDILPEAMLGIGGFADDLVLALAVLAHAFGRNLSPLAEEHWSGEQDLRVVVSDVLGTAQALLGGRVYQRLRRLLATRGIELD